MEDDDDYIQRNLDEMQSHIISYDSFPRPRPETCEMIIGRLHEGIIHYQQILRQRNMNRVLAMPIKVPLVMRRVFEFTCE